MYYSDFKEIFQDEWSLKREQFKTYRGGTLTVIGHNGKISDDKRYIVHCSVCEKDPELFGDGLYEYFKGDLKRGHLKCGCSKRFKNSKDQYFIKIRRLCNGSKWNLLDIPDEEVKSTSKLKLNCEEHGVWESTMICHFLRGARCPKCGHRKISSSKNSKLEKYIEEIDNSNLMNFKVVCNKPGRLFVNYNCKICSFDEYVINGLCSGVFTSSISNLKNGVISCRCSKRFPFTEDQWIYKLSKKLKKEFIEYKFIEWDNKNDPIRSRSKFYYLCPIHGIKMSTLQKFVNKGECCDSCGNHNQQEAYVNILYDKNVGIGLKFGISNDSGKRLSTQNYKNALIMKNIAVYKFPTVESCKAAEKACLSELECGIVSKKEMCDGWTETTSINNLDKIIKIYEDFGGVKVD